ncbi:MAG: DUF5693 family protein [Cellulosilyticaceae bacterium]
MKQQIRKMLLGILILSFFVSTVVAGFRIVHEMAYNTIQVGIRYEDVLDIADVWEQSVQQVLEAFKEIGVTTLYVKENTVVSSNPELRLGDVEQGLVVIKDGSDASIDFAEVNPQMTYLVAAHEETATRLYAHLTHKGIPVTRSQEENLILGIPKEAADQLTKVGTGFVMEDLEIAATLGLGISPEIRYWEEATPASIAWEMTQIEKIPGLKTIYFEDSMIPGYDHPDVIKLVQEKGLGFTEFYAPTQKGFKALAELSKDDRNRYVLTRRYTDEKVPNISTPDTVARYELALTERGIRAFTFNLSTKVDKEEAIQALQSDIQSFIQRAEQKGYIVSVDSEPYTYKQSPKWLLFLVGLGTIALLAYIILEGGAEKVVLLVGAIGAMGYGVALIIKPQLATEGMALATAITFPTYAMVKGVTVKAQNWKLACRKYFEIIGTTFVGCMLVVGLLSQAGYALGVQGFRGVKVAHIVPIILVGGIFLYRYRTSIKVEIKQLLQTRWSYKPLLLLLFIAGVVAIGGIYIMRTGNGEISELEKILRQGLDQLLGVRPRTKEFLIGHPLLIGLLYFGYKNMYWPVLILATIGQISLMNTYAHIHTPLVVSLIRSAYGIGIGMVIGIILIQVVKFIFKVINKWIIKQK